MFTTITYYRHRLIANFREINLSRERIGIYFMQSFFRFSSAITLVYVNISIESSILFSSLYIYNNFYILSWLSHEKLLGFLIQYRIFSITMNMTDRLRTIIYNIFRKYSIDTINRCINIYNSNMIWYNSCFSSFVTRFHRGIL